ncbi:unnamed protein product [Pleuronectes platessa]|uniref:TRIM8/14/16/25/29/45/65 coiled-coil region domain-containing protein n=1 Tax=Pleuronectes platessa TaxID=8262 RepID=A0A9N7VS31_PLEPL|nr:unnamed protein product [Pleuronectes platessa]
MLRGNICPRHNEVKNIINHTDQRCICHLCAADEHKAAVAKTKRKRELWVRGKKIHQRLQELEEDVELLPKNVKVFNVSADVTVKKSKESFTELVEKVKKVRSEVTQKIRSQQEAEVKQVRELREKLEQEITELKRKDDELKQLLDTEDHIQILQNYSSLSPISESTLPSLRSRPLTYFDNVTPAVSQPVAKACNIYNQHVRQGGIGRFGASFINRSVYNGLDWSCKNNTATPSHCLIIRSV